MVPDIPAARPSVKRPSTASIACSATVRPNRAVHAWGMWSSLVMVPWPVASASFTRAGLGLESVRARG